MSEEAFLIEEDEITWKDKIKNLHEYFNKYNPIILLTVRDPKKAIISYYIEMYHALPAHYRKDFGLFLESEYCNIYRYERLISCFNLFKFNVNIINFEKLIKGEYYLSDFFLKENTRDYRILIERVCNIM